ncbi:MAG: hypothetical protein V7K77_08555 [Nostoc sp.]|uniref:hypothetical protein n=1 Tax=Nostoc sp. TaxID=1180 RepID=UPI002FF98EA7
MEQTIYHLIEAQYALAQLAELAEKLSPGSPLVTLLEPVKKSLDLVVSEVRGIDADLHD